MNKFFLPFLIALLLLSGCTPKINGLVHENSFSHSTMVNGGITVGGVTGSTKVMDIKNRHVYSSLLKDEIASNTKGVLVNSDNEIINKIKSEEYAALLDEFNEKGLLSVPNLNKLKDSVSTRYVMFARIDNNNVTNERNVSASATTTYSTRDMGVSLFIFDIKSGKRIWGGELSSSRMNSKKYTNESAAINILRGLSAVSSGNLDSAYPFPEPYSEKNQLSSLFWGFGKNLSGIK